MLERLRQEPSLSFPAVFSSTAELEGAYRWFSNERVDVASVLKPHFERTKDRLRGSSRILVLHDTTDIETSKDVGCRAHFSLAINNPEDRLPLGITSFIPVLRSPRERKEENAESESDRWRNGFIGTRRVLGAATRAVHVGDSEIDSYANFAAVGGGDNFVFRLHIDRKVSVRKLDGLVKLSEVFASTKRVAEREVALSPRKRGNKSTKDMKWHPLRRGRLAKLQFFAKSVVVPRPSRNGSSGPELLPLNIVKVVEIDTPQDEQPVEWVLATDLPISTTEQILEVVDIYRARWVIEEFFKALKTGCSLEARLLESSSALLNAAALFVPIALDLLTLRSLAHSAPETPAANLIDAVRITVLRKFSPYKMPKDPSVIDVLLSIAKMGGHIPNNGTPGWQVLGRGFKKMLIYEEAWIAALEEQKM